MNKLSRILCCVFCLLILCCATSNFLIVSAASKNTTTTSISKIESKAKGFNVIFAKKSKIQGYQVQYSTSSKFEKSKTKTKTVSNAKTNTATISGLKGCNVKYYVRVRTYKVSKDKKIYSSWSKAKSVTTLNHKYNSATCTKAKVCKYCDKTSGEKLGHKWSSATCTKAKTCSRCKKTSGEKLGHKWSSATCTKAKTCSRCKKTIGEKLGHKWGDWNIKKQATVNTEGLKTRSCFNCNKTDQVIIEPLLRYKLLSNGEYAIEGFSDKANDNLVIPETFKGKRVTAIASKAFVNQNIKSLTLSKNIYEIEFQAFKGCKNLSEVKNISTVRVLAPDAFKDCTKLLITIPSSISTNLTLYDTKKIYILESDVQIKNTATLCFSEGIVLNGANYSIKNYGTFSAIGSENNKINFYNVKLLSCNVNYAPNTFSLQYVNYYSGSIFEPTGNSSHSDIFINNCSFYDCVKREYAYIWYPTSCQIKNSYFENWSVLTIGTDDNATALIEGNTFVNCGSDLGYGEDYNSVIMCWAASGNPIQVKNNIFINPIRYALSIKYDGKIDSINNDFRVNKDRIHELIYDCYDDFGISNRVNIIYS